MKHHWDLIMYNIKEEEGKELSLFQCRRCKTVMVDSEESLERYHQEECVVPERMEEKK